MVPDVHHPDSAGEIEIDVAVDIGDTDAVSRRGKHPHRMGKAARHGRLTPPHEGARIRSRDFRTNPDHAHRSVRSGAGITVERRVVVLLKTCIVVNAFAPHPDRLEYYAD